MAEPVLAATDPTISESDRCERLAETIRNIELPETRKRFLSPLVATLHGIDPAGEQALRTLLYVGTTWRAHVQKTRGLRNLVRLLMRRQIGLKFDPKMEEVLDRAAARDLRALQSALSEAVETGIFPARDVVSVLPLEAACLRERTRWLADNADPYSMRTMARLLPRLRIYDELADRLDTLEREAEAGVSQEPDLGLLRFLGDKDFARLTQIFQEMGVGGIVEIWNVQRSLQIDPPVLSALMTLSRTLRLPHEQATWLERAQFWASCARPDGTFSVSAKIPPAAARLLTKAGVQCGPGGIGFRPNDLDLPVLLDEHTLSVDLSGGTRPKPPDWKGLVLSNITRETLILSILDNPKCQRVSGLVETVVVNCKSSQVLCHIAMKRELHSGHQNKAVPAALLRAKVKVPMTLLRRFIHLRYVSRAELKDLSTRAPRADVAKEVGDYVATL